MKIILSFLLFLMVGIILGQCTSREPGIDMTLFPYSIYPEVNDDPPDLSSPFLSTDGDEYVVAVDRKGKYAIIPVTLSNQRDICVQRVVDSLDFPFLAEHGIHSEEELNQTRTITGWSLDTISQLGRPFGLSHSGFMAEDEDIMSVIRSDNQLVKKLGLTHPGMAKPLFHVLNMMDADLSLERWNMARHRWDNIRQFYYHGRQVHVEAYDTKGGQLSIFNDGIKGAFHIKLWHEYEESELTFLKQNYGYLDDEEFESLKQGLGFLNIGEMQPQYIMRYGFYEGHTFWRASPLAIAYIFGFKTLEELENLFKGRLNEVVTNHYIAE